MSLSGQILLSIKRRWTSRLLYEISQFSHVQTNSNKKLNKNSKKPRVLWFWPHTTVEVAHRQWAAELNSHRIRGLGIWTGKHFHFMEEQKGAQRRGGKPSSHTLRLWRGHVWNTEFLTWLLSSFSHTVSYLEKKCRQKPKFTASSQSIGTHRIN